MAGILANSVSVTMTVGTVDGTNSGYLAGESIVLTTNPTGTTYQWAIARPSSSSARCVLSSETASAPTFTPDVAGYYVITCTVDSTTVYVLRVSVVAVATSTALEALRFAPMADASVTAPATGDAVFRSTLGRLRAKNSAGTVRDLESRRGTFTLATGAATIADTSVTASTVVAHHCTTASHRGALTFTVTAGVGVTIASDDGADASVYAYALIG